MLEVETEGTRSEEQNEIWSCGNGANDGCGKGINYSHVGFQCWHWNRSWRDPCIPARRQAM
jgi:hypothetical protein